MALTDPAVVERDLAAERHTSTNSWPSGEKRSVSSPIRSVRSQIAQVRVTFDFVTLIEARHYSPLRNPSAGHPAGWQRPAR